MAVALDLRDNYREVERKLKGIQRKQLPFAFANAINSTLFDGRKYVVKTLWPRSVDVKKRGYATFAYRVDRAKKYRVRGALYDHTGRDILQRQGRGGRAVPYDGQHLAIPTKAALTASGRISSRANLKTQRGNPKIFKANIKGILGIWQRYGRGAKQLRLLYYLKPYVDNPQRYAFYTRAPKVMARVFPGHFNTQFRRALATAR